MGDEASVATFAPDDNFLRRISKRGNIKEGVVHAGAFDDGHSTLSFTLQDGNLRTEAGIDEYHRDKALPSGDLPGIICLSFHDMTEAVRPPLPPRREPDPEDEKYGHLHCCTDRPEDEAQRDQLAKLATRNGVVRQLVRKKKAGVRRPSQ